MKALRFCDCRPEETEFDQKLREWLANAVQRGKIEQRINHILTVVTAYQSLYGCGRCDGTINIVVMTP